MVTVSVRYFAADVDAAIAFYTRHLGFTVDAHPAPGFAILARGDLRLLLNAPTGPGGAAQPMPDGRRPEPRGGTASSSRSTTWTGGSTSSARPARSSATTS
jgi:catechol 2,3-dioxygenase-like lactoylglutathione lyase family enzyme